MKLARTLAAVGLVALVVVVGDEITRLVASSSRPSPAATGGSPSPLAPAVAEQQPRSVGAASPAQWSLAQVVDGDTLDAERNGLTVRVRVIGIDSPERGECGYDTATRSLQRLTNGARLELVPVRTIDDTDRYGRLLRYVIVHPTAGKPIDAGYEQIRNGVAIARYDSRDGYGGHPKEGAYVAADLTSPAVSSCSPQREASSPPWWAPPAGRDSDAQMSRLASAGEAWDRPGPDLDCADIGHPVRIKGPDYHRLDRDGDGIGCE